MDFREQVESGSHDDKLIDSGHIDGHPMLQALDSLEESWSLKDFQDRDSDYTKVGQGTTWSFDNRAIWEYLHYAYFFRGPVGNVTNNLTMLTGVPNEFTFENESVKNQWDAVAGENNFPARWGDIIRNTYLWNDFLTIVFRDSGSSFPRIRNTEPYRIEKVERDEEDPERILSYKRANGLGGYDADDVTHHRLYTIGNDSRGTAIFSRVLRELVYYYKWLEDIYYMGHIRARIPVVRKVKGGSAQVNAEKTRFQYLPGPGRIAIENQGGEWQFPPQYGGIKDGFEGWKLFMTSIASSLNLPYFLVASDYQNNSLASTLSADSPTVRLIVANRIKFATQFKQIVEIALNIHEVDLEIRWPPIVDRDVDKMAKAYHVGIQAGAVSSQTMAEEVFGLDWETEKARINEEDEEADDRGGLGRRVPLPFPKKEEPEEPEEPEAGES